MEKVLIIGCNGQDGHYAANYFINNGYQVFGISRQDSLINNPLFINKVLDINELNEFENYLYEVCPDLILNFSVIHGSHGFNYEDFLIDSYNVNVTAISIILKFLKKNLNSKLTFISSSKVFDLENLESINEMSNRRSNCIYSFQKNYCNDLINFYRDQYQVKASIFYTFNHDSQRRGDEYFLPRIAGILSKAIKNNSYKTNVKTLNFYSDWGYAKEYAEIISKASLKTESEDFLVASGKTIYARDLVREIFQSYSLDYSNHITEDLLNEKTMKKKWTADISKLNSYGYRVNLDAYDVLTILVEHEMKK